MVNQKSVDQKSVNSWPIYKIIGRSHLKYTIDPWKLGLLNINPEQTQQQQEQPLIT